MVKSMMVNGLKIWDMDKENLFGQTEINTQVSGSVIYEMDKENNNLILEMFTMEIGLMIREKDMVIKYTKTVIST